MLVLFCFSRYDRARQSVDMTGPDFSAKSSIRDTLLYIPAPTATLLAFFIFGTTAQLRARYASLLGTCQCRSRNHLLSQRIERCSAQDWNRVSSQEIYGSVRYMVRSDRLESLDLTRTEHQKDDARIKVHQDMELGRASYAHHNHHRRRTSNL